MNRRLARSSDASTFFESFLVAAVSSFLAIRFFLVVTGYPQIGGNGLHIAHMLWGGLLMLIGILLLISYLDRAVQHVAAIIAGIGFGVFIDEIGKFVTSDNDYFFQPAVALIYVLFVVMFLVTRTLVGRHRLSPSESLANALDLLQSTIGRAIEPDDRTRIRRLLDDADPDSELVRDLGRYLDRLPRTPDVLSPVERVSSRLGDAYRRLVANDWFERAVVVFVVLYALAAVVGVLAVTFAVGERETSTVIIAQAVSTGIGVVLILRGVVSLRTSRVEAYHWFMRGLLVWILVSQVFVFYSSQLAGLGGLAVDLAAYGTLRFAIRHEGEADEEAAPASQAPTPSGAGR